MSDTPTGFASLGLPFNVLRAVEEQGYETPSPIQQQAIPHLLAGKDVLGLAQTGTGKTAAFTLPILARTDANARTPQVLVLAPTRELAQQVAAAIESYAKHLPGIKTTCIYGGQDFSTQFRALKNGPQFVVGTPGRVMDHIRRGTLKLDEIKAVVLDEADEMLRMGFIDDVNWILEHVPTKRQVALFSATMPRQIKEVAEKHLNSPVEVRIENKTATNDKIAQSFWLVRNLDKNEALLRICETQDMDAMMIFVRTKQATEEVAEYLRTAGYKCEALNGDVAQAQRERAVDRLKKGQIDIVVATDVAARGLDVERISHVVNYDIPYDAESYVHRIGRTGRAGRTGSAILFVRPRERRMLSTIERVTRQKIAEMQLPSIDEVNVKRRERFKERILESVQGKETEIFKSIIGEVLANNEALDPVDVAAALAQMAQGGKSLFLTESVRKPREYKERNERGGRDSRGERGGRDRGRGRDMADKPLDKKPMPLKDNPDIEMKRYRLAVGYKDGVKPGNIVGAIANEANIESKFIGHIEIFDGFATVDLPSGMPSEVVDHLKKTRICGRPLNIEDINNAKSGDAPKRVKKEGYKSKDGSGLKARSRKPAKRKEAAAE
ncbi:DEAD/DEAH box helicase [Oceaniserpentilla sp. 4NH20-0058]|uniref:DEAD/DEAH box helicase n=1 Tax=Oceaniserpentilla sp. 4NH20-0058 TaxID=3127660 RepID=UPI003108F821